MRIDVYSRSPLVRQGLRAAVVRAPLMAAGPLRFYQTWTDLIEAVRTDLPDVVVGGGRGRPGTPQFVEDFELLADVVPPWKVIVYMDEVGKASLAVASLARIGFFRCLLTGVDDHPTKVRRALAATLHHSSLRDYLAGASGRVAPEAHALLNSVCGVWPPPRNVGELARQLATTERTLRRWVAQAELPCPKRLHQWLMLSQAVALQRLGVTSVAALAYHLEVPYPSSLSRVCRRLTGLRLGDLLQDAHAAGVVHDVVARASA